jgi:SSS family solute:Na+ symporter
MYLALLLVFAVAQIAIGLYIARRVRVSSDFFVAGRALGPGLLFSTFLAANIGAGSTVGAAGLAYSDGLSAWWWVGSAGIGSLVLAFWVGPRIRALAAAHDLRTLGDFLEWRYDRRVRAVLAALLWFGMLAILAGQLVALSKLLQTVAGWDAWVGCVAGGVIMTIYATAGGLKSSAWVNILQLAVKMLGFFLALPFAIGSVGGMTTLRAAAPTADYWNFWHGGDSGWIYLAMLGPAFIVSPGLLQKIYGARDDRTVRLGVGANAGGLLAYAIMPVLLGMCARFLHPGLPDPELGLPMLLVHDLPPVVGALTMAALFSAEVSAADAALFALTTSLSQDVYRRFIRPTASDARVLTVARWTTVASGALGIGIALVSPSVSATLSIFYTLMGVSLFVPVVAGLGLRRVGTPEVLAAVAAGVAVFVAVRLGGRGLPVAGLTPAMWGLLASSAATLVVALTIRNLETRR